MEIIYYFSIKNIFLRFFNTSYCKQFAFKVSLLKPENLQCPETMKWMARDFARAHFFGAWASQGLKSEGWVPRFFYV
jgi:hypothetical protein